MDQYNKILNLETQIKIILSEVETIRKDLAPDKPPPKKKRLSQRDIANAAINKVKERRAKRAAKQQILNNQ